MNRYIAKIFLGLVMFLVAFGVQAQSRKFVSNYSQFQNYFNPALTGYEGSVLRGFVRNQWGGVEGAPKTYFISAELDFGELGGEEDPELTGKNAFSINLLQNTYGAFRENELTANYAARIRISEKHNLRLGAGVTYQGIRLDGNALSAEEANDPTLSQYLGTFSNMNVIDFNLGMALTHYKYFFSYGVQRVNGGNIQGGDEFMDGYPAEQMIIAGYREALGENLAVTASGFYRSRKDLPDVLEVSIKALMMDRFWLGFGHRFDYATNAQMGVIFGKMKLGYVYEFPVGKSYLLPGGIHEFSLTMNLFRPNERRNPEEVLIW